MSEIAALAKQKVSYSPPLGAPNPANPLVYFDIALGRYGDATPLGRILMEVPVILHTSCIMRVLGFHSPWSALVKMACFIIHCGRWCDPGSI